MINEALTCITEEINEYFRRKLNEKEDRVILSGLVHQDGSVAIETANKIALTLVNIEEEPVAKNTVQSQAPVKINLHILFTSYFSKYDVALHFLDNIILFFQEKRVFTSSNTPRLDSSIEKISIEMLTLPAEKLNNLWATLGAKYMPSVSYKLRMLSFDSSARKEYRPAVTSARDD